MGRIVVIDDDQDILDVMLLILDVDHNVFASQSGDILQQLDSIRPDLIIIDDLLYNERGSELCRKLKHDPLTSKIPVLLFTARHDGQMIAEDVGADGIISKPFDLEVLVSTVNNYFVLD